MITTTTWIGNNPPSVVSHPARSFVHLRTSSGYSGPRPRPLVDHPWRFSVNEFSLRTSRFYEDRFNKVRIVTEGANIDFNISSASLVIKEDANLLNAAISKLYETIRGSADLSIDIAEAGQTKKMLSLSSQFVSAASLMRRKFRTLAVPASVWLTVTYGGRPLIQSIFELAEKSLYLSANLARTKVRSRKNSVLENIPIDVWVAAGGPISQRMKTVGSGKISYTHKVSFLPERFIDTMSQFSSLNPLSIAWELLPYSFVADWFFDLGSYLRSMESSLLLAPRFTGGYVSKLTVYEGSIQDTKFSQNMQYTQSEENLGRVRYSNFVRDLLLSAPTPNLPRFGADLGSSRLISAASLLAMRLK